MIASRLSVWMEDGPPFEVHVDGRDVRAWEKTHRRSFLGAEGGQSYTAMTWLAWNSARRAGKTTQSWEEFDAACLGVEATADEPVDPSQPAVGVDSS